MNIAILEDNTDDTENLKRFIERFYGEDFCSPDCYRKYEINAENADNLIRLVPDFFA